jgi:hypothetical protein
MLERPCFSIPNVAFSEIMVKPYTVAGMLAYYEKD